MSYFKESINVSSALVGISLRTYMIEGYNRDSDHVNIKRQRGKIKRIFLEYVDVKYVVSSAEKMEATGSFQMFVTTY